MASSRSKKHIRFASILTVLAATTLQTAHAQGLDPVPSKAPATRPAARPVARPLPPSDAPITPLPFRVVIDPGHGGSDFGAVTKSGGRLVSEKELTLLLAQQIILQLRARGMVAVLTRSTDQDLALGPRTQIANQLKADLFISIHMNSMQVSPTSAKTDAEGVETYILNNTSEASSVSLARHENSVLGPKERQGAPDEVDVALILRDLRLDANLSESKRLACTVLAQLVAVGTRASPHAISTRNRGVKQALFHVLLGAEMPSILVEAGFLNNAHDRGLILDPRSRRALASALARAVENFRDTKNTPRAAETLSKCKVH